MPRRIDRLTAGTLEGILADAEQAGRMRTAGGPELNQYSGGKLLRDGDTSDAVGFWLRDVLVFAGGIYLAAGNTQRTAVAPSTQYVPSGSGDPGGQVFLTDQPTPQGAPLIRDQMIPPLQFPAGFSSGIGNYARANDAVNFVRLAGCTGGTFRLGWPSEGIATGPIPFNATSEQIGQILAAAVGLADLSALWILAAGKPGYTPFTWTIRFLGLGFELLNLLPVEVDGSGLEGPADIAAYNLNLTATRRNRYAVVLIQGSPKHGFWQLIVNGTPTAPQIYDIDPDAGHFDPNTGAWVPTPLNIYPTIATVRAALEGVAGIGNVVVRGSIPPPNQPPIWFRIDFVGEAEILEYGTLDVVQDLDAGLVTLGTLYDPPAGAFPLIPTNPSDVTSGSPSTLCRVPLGELIRYNQSLVFDTETQGDLISFVTGLPLPLKPGMRMWRAEQTYAAMILRGRNGVIPTAGIEQLLLISPGGILYFGDRSNPATWALYGTAQQYGPDCDGVATGGFGELNRDDAGEHGQNHLCLMPSSIASAPLKWRLLRWVGYPEVTGGEPAGQLFPPNGYRRDPNAVVLTPRGRDYTYGTWEGFPLVEMANDEINPILQPPCTFGILVGYSDVTPGLPLYSPIAEQGGNGTGAGILVNPLADPFYGIIYPPGWLNTPRFPYVFGGLGFSDGRAVTYTPPVIPPEPSPP